MLDRERFNLSRWAIEHSRWTIAGWLAIAVAGILAFSSLKYSLFPEITFPVVIVRAQFQLEDILQTEAQLTNPLEASLQSVEGLAQLQSSTYSGQTVVSLLLDTNIKLKTAAATVQDQLQEVSLPDNTEVTVIPFNLNESSAVNYVLLSEKYSIDELSQIAKEKIVPAIARVSGVNRVDVLGNPQSDNKNNASLVRFNNQDAIALRVIKQGDANTLEVVARVDTAVKQLQTGLPDIQLVVAETPAGYIKEATNATVEALWGAIVLAIVIIFPFLKNWRATLIAAIAIPMSLLGTFIFMAVANFNLETLTLLALALVIGIIIDDAIVEVENIIRHIDNGDTPRQAALKATEEIGLTVSISTLTIVAVFVPIALMGGTLGQFFRPFGLIISVAVLTSLLVARTLSPVLAIYWLTAKQKRGVSERVNPIANKIVDNYRQLLQWSLNRRRTVIGIAIASLIAGIALTPLIPQGFVPQLDRGEFNIVYTTPLPKIASRSSIENNPTPQTEEQSTSNNFSWLRNLARSPEQILLRKTITVGKQIETLVLNNPEVESVYTIAGVRGEPNKGKLYIKLNRDRSATTAQIQEQIRNNLPLIPQTIISVEDIPFVETGEDPSFKMGLVGEDLTKLRDNAIALQQKLQQLPGFADVRISPESQLREITHLDRKRIVYINANLTPDKAIGDATKQASAIAKSFLPADINFDLEGDSARANKILGEFAITLVLAIILMLIVLYLPFRRWIEPLVIGLSLPLSIVGAMFALLITRSDFGMISLIGLIFLLGLLDKNAILLLDYANQLRRSGIERTHAILETGIVRLRPIIMTTFSTILGMLPIALGWGAGAELRQPMAVSIIGGLITSSLLSLIVVPVLYTLLEDSFNSH